MGDVRWIYTTWPSAEAAADAARTLVGERLAACANVIPGALSVFWWQGEVQAEPEAVMVLKTRWDRARALRERLIALHPYDTPAFVALDVDEARSHPDFLDWVQAESAPETD